MYSEVVQPISAALTGLIYSILGYWREIEKQPDFNVGRALTTILLSLAAGTTMAGLNITTGNAIADGAAAVGIGSIIKKSSTGGNKLADPLRIFLKSFTNGGAITTDAFQIGETDADVNRERNEYNPFNAFDCQNNSGSDIFIDLDGETTKRFSILAGERFVLTQGQGLEYRSLVFQKQISGSTIGTSQIRIIYARLRPF